MPEEPAPALGEAVATTTRPRLPRRARVWIGILAAALVIALGAVTFQLVTHLQATSLIEQQQRELEEQRELIDRKETFGAAMQTLLQTASALDGVPLEALLPMNQYQAMVNRAWTQRWKPEAVDREITAARTATADLEAAIAAAETERTTNVSGTAYEAITDELGRGFVVSLLGDADTLCESDVLACVSSDDPLTVHFDARDYGLPYMTDWLRTGIASHEFAHVLQFANPKLTERALEAFGGDYEAHADCFALTFLDGWTLDHTIWVSSFEYYEVSMGYGYTCTAEQMQGVRDWYAELGITAPTISQE